MEITNKHGLPEVFVNAVSNGHKPIPGRYGVNDLVGAPLARRLKMEHWDELEQDVSDMLWMILGSSVHALLQGNAPKESLSEEKLIVAVDGHWVVGVPDLYHNHGLIRFRLVLQLLPCPHRYLALFHYDCDLLLEFFAVGF